MPRARLTPPSVEERWPVATTGRATTVGITLMLLLALVGVGLSLMPVVADELTARFGYSDSQIGLLTSVFMLALGAVAIPWGLAGARWGGRMLFLGFLIGIAGSFIFAFSTSYAGFLIGRLAQGIGLGVIVPVVGTIIPGAIPPGLRGRAWGIFGTGHGLGVVLALLIMPSIAEAGGYRGVFLVTAGATIVFGGLALAQGPVRRKPAHAAGAAGSRALLRALATTVVNRQVILLCLFNLAALAVGVGALVWTPLFLRDHFAASLGVSAYLTAGLGAAQLIANPLGAVAMGRWGKKKVIVTCMLLMIACTAVVPFLPRLWLVFVFVTMAGFLSMAYFSPVFSGTAEVVSGPHEIGAATGLLEVFGFIGALVAPWLFGLFLDLGGQTAGYVAGYVMLAAITGLCCIGLAFFRLPACAPSSREAGAEITLPEEP
jgi:MFS family permease